MANDKDQKILSLLRRPETRNYGFQLLVDTYKERLYSIVRRMVIRHDDADDIVQDVFIRIWENIDGFREESSLYTWIYRIAINESLRFLKSKRLRLFLPMLDISAQLEKLIDDPQHFSGNQIERKLQKAILKLPDKQRLVFNMRYYEGLTYEEISEMLGTSVGALKASYHLAVKKIEKYLD
ncbi:MAG: RNA polymerase sigma factor [Bacteroidales bacterium]